MIRMYQHASEMVSWPTSDVDVDVDVDFDIRFAQKV
jgi:hypothetical protein